MTIVPSGNQKRNALGRSRLAWQSGRAWLDQEALALEERIAELGGIVEGLIAFCDPDFTEAAREFHQQRAALIAKRTPATVATMERVLGI